MPMTIETNQKHTKCAHLFSFNDKLWGMFSKIPDSALSLFARIAVAGIFWRSGQTKVNGWEINEFTFEMFKSEYNLPLIPYEIATYIATIAEHFFPILLIIGLATRYSAGALLIMTLTIQIFVYPSSWPDHAVWAISFLFIMSRGPGKFSLDHLFKKTLPICVK